MEYIAICGFKIVKEKANSKQEAEDKLLDRGLIPTVLFYNFFKKDKILSNKQASNFFESLGFLFKATGSMTKSLRFIEDRYDKIKIKKQSKSKIGNFINTEVRKFLAERFKKRLELARGIRQKLESGYILSNVLAEFKFDEIALGIISVAERGTGDFAEAFKRLTDYYDTKERYSSGFLKELAYPAILLIAAFTGFLIFLFYVIPAFAKFFKTMPHIPAKTLATLNFFANIRHNFFLYIVVILVFVAVLSYIWLSDYKNIRNGFYKVLANFPILGHFFRFSHLKWYLYEFGLLATSGEVYSRIAEHISDNVTNKFFKDKWSTIHLHLSGGSTLLEAFTIADFLRPEDIDRVSSSEISGSIGETMLTISKEYEQIVDLQMKVITKAINYVVLIIIAIFIVFIFAGIYMPMMEGMMGMAK